MGYLQDPRNFIESRSLAVTMTATSMFAVAEVLKGQGRDNPARQCHREGVTGGAPSVGARLRQLRKLRGLTQHQLAAGTHFSLSLVKKIEQGSVPPSAAFVSVVARVLRVKAAYLYGTEERELAEQPAVEAIGIAELRLALDSYDDPRPEGRPLTLTEAVRRLQRLAQRVYALRYAEAVHDLPALLPHLYLLAQQGEPGCAALHDGYRLAASLAGQYRQADLAAIATERHVALAPSTGDPLRVAISAYHRTSRHLQSGGFDVGLRTLERAQQHLGDGPADHAVAVQLHLRAAVIAARGGDRERGDDHVGQAREISERFNPPPSPYYNIDASRLNIDVHWCAIPVENYDGTTSIQRAGQVAILDPKRPERVGHHHLDQARAWLLFGNRDQALAELNAARRIAPDRIRHHPQVRATVLALAQMDRRVTDSLASFARWAGIAV
jgi:transcriptional regulator with XRE-family HTH domain